MTEYFKKIKELEGKKVTFDEFYSIFPVAYTKDPQSFKSKLVEQSKFLEKSGIECTKAVLKQLLGSDYNNSAIEPPAEPKKPASLNLFLQWRKEFADAPVYKNLPPQEGLAADDDLSQEEKDKQAKVNTFVKENIDFELLDLEADIANKKKPITDPDAALDKEEEIFEGAEQILAERLGEPFGDKLVKAQTDSGLYKSDFTRDHEGAFKAMNENKTLEDSTGANEAELFDDTPEHGRHPVIDKFISDTDLSEAAAASLKEKLYAMTENLNEAPAEENPGATKEKKCKPGFNLVERRRGQLDRDGDRKKQRKETAAKQMKDKRQQWLKDHVFWNNK